MIVVRVELWSAIDGRKTELARMHIINDGTGNGTVGNYECNTLRGRSTEALDRGQPQRTGRVEEYRRLDHHVWNLVNRALTNMGYLK